ncbi:MAG: hypothetical protein QCI82_01895 [Candidatus Thermoplasmatota archaeon]|nr:hypothetical protein [Candidatus Thermoplasmatota archaeon]
MKDRFDLILDGRKVSVSVKDDRLVIEGKGIVPSSVAWYSRRRMPFYSLLAIGALIAVIGIFAGTIVNTIEGFEWAALVIVFPLTVLAILIFGSLAGAPQELVSVRTDETEHLFGGDVADLRLFHYQASKITISKMPSDPYEKQEGRAGSMKGSDLLNEEERTVMKKDLNRLPGKRRTVKGKICPHCSSTEMYYEAGFLTGYVYHCKRCDYVGSFVIEKELEV